MNEEMKQVIKEIKEKTIYKDDSNLSQVVRQETEKNQWIREYSDLGAEELNTQFITGSAGLENQRKSHTLEIPKTANLKKQMTVRTMQKEYESNEAFMKHTDSVSFDIFQFERLIGRDKTLPLLTSHFILQNGVDDLVDH